MKRRSFISKAGVAAGATVAASTIGAPAIAQKPQRNGYRIQLATRLPWPRH